MHTITPQVANSTLKTFFAIVLVAVVSSSFAQNVGINNSSPKSTLDVAGSIGTSITTITGPTTLDQSHSTILATPTSPYTISLPSASTCMGRLYNIVYFGTAGGYSITISCANSQVIVVEGNSSQTRTLNSGSISLQSNGFCWHSINNGTQGATGATGATGSIGLTGATGPTGATGTVSGLTSGQVAFGSSTGGVAQSSNLFWNNTGGLLGIGTNSPTQKLEILNGNLLLSNSNGTATQLQFQGTSTGITSFKAGVQGAANINYILPTTQATASQVLSNDGAGNLSWATVMPSNGQVTGGTKVLTSSGTPYTIIGTDFFVLITGTNNQTINFPIPSAGNAGRIIICRNTTNSKTITYTTATGSYMVGAGAFTPSSTITTGDNNLGERNVRFMSVNNMWYAW